MHWDKIIPILVSTFAVILYFCTIRRPGVHFETGFHDRMKFCDTRGPWSFKKRGIGVYALQGRRPYMEDRFSILEAEDFLAVAIYDGHGGAFFADYAERYLLPSILKEVQENVPDNLNLTRILIDQFLAIDQSAMETGGKEKEHCGSTALVAVVFNQKLYIANAGDCRAVAKKDGSKTASQITTDHKPDNPIELARIKAAGGFVSFKGVWRVGGSLAVSRAFGDAFLKREKWIVAEPDVHIIDMNNVQIEYVVLASDGLWDVFSSQEVLECVDPYVKRKQYFGAQELAEKALQKGSSDNVCVIVVTFQN